ncbi:MAG: DUF3105 domain-containing protein [Nocardioides sp.]|nr:DUF3105 domain-containing protein [Nocardioides sp.]
MITRVFLLVGLLALVGALVWQVYEARKPSTGGDPHTDNPALQDVQTFHYVGGQHTSDPVTYAQTPPAGGPHDPVWDDCGVYTAPIRNENGVHDLEHGTVWITYRPGLSTSDVQSLETALGTVKSKKTILSPYPGLPSPVVVTVWNAQLDLNGANDSRLPVFLQEYGDGHTAPEAAFATCQGGAHVMASPSNP